MTDRPGPLARPRSPYVVYDSRAWPSPLWAYNTFSYVPRLSPLSHSRLHSITLCNLLHCRSIPFDSCLCRSVWFYVSLVISKSRCI
jgi:hypothetical protein